MATRRKLTVEARLRRLLDYYAPDIDVDDEARFVFETADGQLFYRPPVDLAEGESDSKDRDTSKDDDASDDNDVSAENDDADDDVDEDDDDGGEIEVEIDDEPPLPRSKPPAAKPKKPAAKSTAAARKRTPTPSAKKKPDKQQPVVDSKHDPLSDDYDPQATVEAWVSGEYGGD